MHGFYAWKSQKNVFHVEESIHVEILELKMVIALKIKKELLCNFLAFSLQNCCSWFLTNSAGVRMHFFNFLVTEFLLWAFRTPTEIFNINILISLW